MEDVPQRKLVLVNDSSPFTSTSTSLLVRGKCHSWCERNEVGIDFMAHDLRYSLFANIKLAQLLVTRSPAAFDPSSQRSLFGPRNTDKLCEITAHL